MANEKSKYRLRPVTRGLWVVRCPVCALTFSGFRCLGAAGLRGFFFCPNCATGLEMRGRWISVMILLLVLGVFGIFTYFFFEFFRHRTIGLVLFFSTGAIMLLFVAILCARHIVQLGRQDVDASFVL
jgi:hypothetical protein